MINGLMSWDELPDYAKIFEIEAKICRAYCDVLQANERLQKLHEKAVYLVRNSDPIDFSAHDTSMKAAAPGFRFLRSGLLVLPVYSEIPVGKEALNIDGVVPIIQIPVWEKGCWTHLFKIHKGRKEAWFPALPDLIHHWADQWK